MKFKTVFIVVKDVGKRKQFRVFSDSDKATAFFRKLLEKEFAKHNRMFDDNGDYIETCIKFDECLIAGHHHYIDVGRYYE